MRVVRHSKLEEDILQAFRYLNQQESDLGEYFIAELEETIHSIERNPLIWSMVYRDVRRIRLRRFKAYSIRYRVLENEGVIQILSVIHGARHPNQGKDRR